MQDFDKIPERERLDLITRMGLFYTQMLSNNFFALEALKQRFCDNGAERQLVRNIYRNNLLMLRFIRRCMLYANCRYGSPDVMENAELRGFLKDLVADIKKNSGGKLAPVFECEKKEVAAAVDGRRLTSAIMALVLNASEAGAGEIIISLDADEDELRISVCDNGEKADEKLINAALDNGVENPDGSGMGLMTASMIAAAHGGSLKYSYGEDGNCFTLELPIKISDKLRLEAGHELYKDRFDTVPVELCDMFIEVFDSPEENAE